MPLLRLETTVTLSKEQTRTVLGSLSKVVAGAIGKPKQYVMITISHSAMSMSGKAVGAAFVDIRSIGGLSSEVNRKLSQQVCGVLKNTLEITPDRVYPNFTDVEAGNWGWNGSTFG